MTRYLWWGIALLAGCSESTQRSAPGCPADLAWLVGYRALAVGPGGAPVAWFDAKEPPAVRSNGGATTATWMTDAGPEPLEITSEGTLHRVGAPRSVGRGRLEVKAGQCALEIEATWWSASPRVAAAEQAAAAGRWAEAEHALASLEADPLEGVFTLGPRAALVVRSGDRDRGIALFEEGARKAAGRGHYTEAGGLLRAAVFRLLEVHRYPAALRLLDEAERLVAGRHDPEGLVRLAYYRGRLESALLRSHEAERHFRAAAEGATAIGDHRMAATAEDALAALLSQQGQHQKAFASLRPRPAAGDHQAWGLALNRAWYQLEAMRSCQIPNDYKGIYAEVAQLARTPPPAASPPERANAWVNAAQAARLAGDLAAAEAALVEARAADVGGGLDPLFTERLTADLLVDRGQLPAAAVSYQKQIADAGRRHGDRVNDDAWRALHGLGRIALTRGDRSAALAHWMEAAEILDAVGRRIELQAGRSSYHADRRGLLEALLSQLLEAGRAEDALRVLDRFDAPVLRALEQASGLQQLDGERLARWSRALQAYEEARAAEPRKLEECGLVPIDQEATCRADVHRLRREAATQVDAAHTAMAPALNPHAAFSPAALAPDEAALVFVPLRPPGTCEATRHALLVHAGKVTVATGQPSEIIGSLPIRHLYVVDGGSRAARDLPWAEWRGKPLATHVGITLIPRLSWLNRPLAPPGTGALIVSDPDATLPGARSTGERLSRRFPTAHFLTRTQATRAAVLPALTSGLRWFEFDGHGALDDPWNAHLVLSDNATLTATDILAHRPRIGTVVLTACQSGDAGQLSGSESLGLAEAFLLAGADQVLAAEGNVPDREAALFMERFHAEGGLDDAVGAWRRTIEAFHQQNPAPDADWRRWRLFGRRTAGRAPKPPSE